MMPAWCLGFCSVSQLLEGKQFPGPAVTTLTSHTLAKPPFPIFLAQRDLFFGNWTNRMSRGGGAAPVPPPALTSTLKTPPRSRRSWVLHSLCPAHYWTCARWRSQSSPSGLWKEERLPAISSLCPVAAGVKSWFNKWKGNISDSDIAILITFSDLLQ